jgi:FAD synthase
MYKWISPTGEVVKTKTIEEFSEKYHIRKSNAKSLVTGKRYRHKGFCSYSPKAKQARGRFTMTLVHTKTGERKILGQSIRAFAREHHLCANELGKLINKHRIIYRGWVLESTLKAAHNFC